MELNGDRPTWNQFVELVNAQFGPLLTDSPVGELAMLRRTRTVDEFSKRFIALSYRDTSLTEPLQIQLFITGLGDPLGTDVMLQQPSILDDVVIFARAYRDTSLTEPLQIQLFITGLGDPLGTDVTLQQPSILDDVVIFTRAYEQRNASRECVQPSPTHHYSRQTAKAASPTLALPTPGATGETTPTTVLRLAPAKIAQWRKDGKCFHCNDLFVQGHKKQCKQLFVIEVLVEECDNDHTPEGTDPTISLHALTGIQPRSGPIM
jgi:hypothetical protein